MANRWFNQFPWTLEKNVVSLWANIGFGDTSVITTTADVGGNKAGTFFRVKGFTTGTQYYGWFKVSGTGSDPNNVGETGVEIDISTGATATTIATAIYNAFVTAYAADFTVTHSTNTVTFVSVSPGCLNAHDGLSMYATGFGFANTSLPILSESKSFGFKNFTRTSAGLFVATTGTYHSSIDVYNRILTMDYTFLAATGTPAAPLAYVTASAINSAGTLTIKTTAVDGTTATDPACGEELWLYLALKNTTAQ